jgi:hypothetical protein
VLSRIPPEISLDLNDPKEYEQFLRILSSQHAEQTDHPTCSIQLEGHTESEKWVRVGTSLHFSGLTSLTVPSATRPPCTTPQASMSVDTTTAEVLPISETSCNLVPSTVYENHHSEFHLCLTSHTLCVFKCPLKVAPQSLAFACIFLQFSANTARSTTKAGVLKALSGLPTKSATNASLLGLRKCIGVLVCSMCAMTFAVGVGGLAVNIAPIAFAYNSTM